MAPRRIDPKTSAAYRAAGWDINDSGRAIAPLGRLSPTYVAPPGFSKLPLPRRRWRADKPAPEVPRNVASISAIPAGLNPAYDYTAAGYVRNAIGDTLHDYRSQKARDPHAEPLVKRRTLTKEQYTMLQGLAAPGAERENFMRAAATKRITVEG